MFAAADREEEEDEEEEEGERVWMCGLGGKQAASFSPILR